jgi:hypothetical protein
VGAATGGTERLKHLGISHENAHQNERDAVNNVAIIKNSPKGLGLQVAGGTSDVAPRDTRRLATSETIGRS